MLSSTLLEFLKLVNKHKSYGSKKSTGKLKKTWKITESNYILAIILSSICTDRVNVSTSFHPNCKTIPMVLNILKSDQKQKKLWLWELNKIKFCLIPEQKLGEGPAAYCMGGHTFMFELPSWFQMCQKFWNWTIQKSYPWADTVKAYQPLSGEGDCFFSVWGVLFNNYSN